MRKLAKLLVLGAMVPAVPACSHSTYLQTPASLSILPLRTLRPDGTGDVWAQVRAIRYAINNGADVINLSYSFEVRSQLLDEVLGQVTCVAGGVPDCHAVDAKTVSTCGEGKNGAVRFAWRALTTLKASFRAAADWTSPAVRLPRLHELRKASVYRATSCS
mgnify:CR=1 FL=1